MAVIKVVVVVLVVKRRRRLIVAITVVALILLPVRPATTLLAGERQPEAVSVENVKPAPDALVIKFYAESVRGIVRRVPPPYYD